MPSESFCSSIEDAVVDLLTERDCNETVVTARDIAEKTDIKPEDFNSPSQHIGWVLGFGGCRDLDKVKLEVIHKDNSSNKYRIYLT